MTRNQSSLLVLFFLIICLISVGTVAVWLVSGHLLATTSNPINILWLICILLIGGFFILYSLTRQNQNVITSNISNAEAQKSPEHEKYDEKGKELVNKIYNWERHGLDVVENPAISLVNEKIYYQFPYEWMEIGSERAYRGNLFITDTKIRLVSDSTRQFPFNEILQFAHEETTFKLYPDNKQAIQFLPLLKGTQSDQWLEIAKFYAVWKLAEGKKLQDFAPTFCKILNITCLGIEDKIIYEETN